MMGIGNRVGLFNGAQYIIIFILCSVYCILYTVYIVGDVIRIDEETLYNIQCTVYSVSHLLYSQCIFHTVQCTMYSLTYIV